MLHRTSKLEAFLSERPRQRKFGMRFGNLNLRTLYRAGSLKTVPSDLAKRNLNLVAVQDVRWGNGSSQPTEDCTFFHGTGMLIIS
jgi:hypothetical protein